jgi:surface carbohydrate biosynthesis protein
MSAIFTSIIKIFNIIKYLIRAKPIWKGPRKSDVLIFDIAGNDILLEYLEPWHPEVLPVRGEQINVIVLLKSLFRGGAKPDAYIDCFIEKVRPRLIVTLVDNSKHFYTISNRHPDVKTLFIQNGIRSYYMDSFQFLDTLNSEVLKTYFVDYMLVFGSSIGKHYKQYFEGNMLPMGSVKNNYAPKEKLLNLGVIAFVSQWRSTSTIDIDGINSSRENIFEKSNRLVIQCLANYAKKKNKRLIIVQKNQGRTDFLRQEEMYLKGILGYLPECAKLDSPYSNYQVIDSAEVVVTINSTLGFESIARGKKTAIFSILSSLLEVKGFNYGWPAEFPDVGPFWTNKLDSDIFIEILDYLFEIDDKQWQKDLDTTNYSSIMEYDPGNTRLMSVFENELGTPPPRAN